MRKQFKKVLSMVLSAAMVLTLGSGLELKTADAADTLTVAGEFDAKISSNIAVDENGEWTWADIATSKVDFSGSDSATVSLKHEGKYAGANEKGELVFCVDVVGLNAKVASGNAIELADINIKLDGKAFAVDKAKVLTGDLEENGNYRMEIYNVWGKGTDKNPPIDVAAFKYESSLEITATLKVVTAPDPTEEPPVVTPTPKPTRDPEVTAAPRPTEVTSGTPDEILKSEGIHAYLTYQTSGWDCRNDVNEITKSTNDAKMNGQYGINYIKAGGVESYDADKFKVVDVLLDHDGEYTVSLGDVDLTNADKFNWLGVATDLNVADYPGVTATVSALKIDDEPIAAAAGKKLLSRGEDSYYTFMAANTYAQKDKVDEWKDPEEAAPLFVSQLAMPEKSIEITFTITGLEDALMDIDAGTYTQLPMGDLEKPAPPTPTPNGGGDKPTPPTPTPNGGGDKPTPTPNGGGNNPNQSAKPSATPAGNGGTGTTDAVVGAKVGASVTVGAFKLKVTKAATAKSAGTATVTGLSKSGKKAKALNVKASMKSGAASYKVNKLGKNAFKGAKATKITLSKSINSIPAGAFANCKALKTLTLNAKLKKVTKKAFKGCKKKIAVKGKGKKANVKLLKKSGYKKFK